MTALVTFGRTTFFDVLRGVLLGAGAVTVFVAVTVSVAVSVAVVVAVVVAVSVIVIFVADDVPDDEQPASATAAMATAMATVDLIMMCTPLGVPPAYASLTSRALLRDTPHMGAVAVEPTDPVAIMRRLIDVARCAKARTSGPVVALRRWIYLDCTTGIEVTQHLAGAARAITLPAAERGVDVHAGDVSAPVAHVGCLRMTSKQPHGRRLRTPAGILLGAGRMPAVNRTYEIGDEPACKPDFVWRPPQAADTWRSSI